MVHENHFPLESLVSLFLNLNGILFFQGSNTNLVFSRIRDESWSDSVPCIIRYNIRSSSLG